MAAGNERPNLQTGTARRHSLNRKVSQPIVPNLPRPRRLLPVLSIPDNRLPLVPTVHHVWLSSQAVKTAVIVGGDGVAWIERDGHPAHRVASGIGNATGKRVL